MKRFLTFSLIILAVFCVLPGRGHGGEEINSGLIFVNNSDAAIVEVIADFTDQLSGTRNADNSPLKRGETFGFEAGEYPVTVLVYDKAVGRIEEGELARIVIPKAPAEGERWYVTAQDGAHGLVLTADTKRPEGA